MRSLYPLWQGLWLGLCWLSAAFAMILIYMWWSLWRYEVTICQAKDQLSADEAFECINNGGVMSLAAIFAVVFLLPLLLTKLPALGHWWRNSGPQNKA